MPKGVEHVGGEGHLQEAIAVQSSPMPKGVEHTKFGCTARRSLL